MGDFEAHLDAGGAVHIFGVNGGAFCLSRGVVGIMCSAIVTTSCSGLVRPVLVMLSPARVVFS